MRIIQITAGVLAVLGLSTVLSACKDDRPMERAGKAMDQAADDVSNAAENTKDKLDDAME
jgi:predicted small secreted protein